jgi:hypothetical protein
VATFVNTILADNVDHNTLAYHDCFNANSSSNISLGHNVVEDPNNCAFAASGDETGIDPDLDALADNGGNTWTHALLEGSLAIDGGDDAYCPATDQRGKIRFSPCDVGAYEYVLSTYLPLVLRSY